MLTAALLLPAVGAGIRGIAGLLRQVRAATTS
jgi:hypothetical protein